ncbi:T9SS type A sorting domain-containing protein [uncultured Dokdonia sp.]|uniref:T9SS type A sorting domain-containing protein n=1 Tax=uncultured Dokdonia sp. TaxID=575653 RepID=UPI00260F7EC7|nr:T9SS type A sorting domain-containing protein [uncultured Dokdonia sp.]
MKKHYFNETFCAILLALFFLVISCQKETSDSRRERFEKTEGKKNVPGHLDEYLEAIQKPLGTEESTYPIGYRYIAYESAMQRLSTQGFLESDSFDINEVVMTERGPNNVPGRGREIIVDPSDNNTWFVTTAGGGFWVTRDAGSTWENLTDFNTPTLSISAAAVYEGNSDIIYIGSGEPFGNGNAIVGIGLLKTTDGGNTWEYLENTTGFGDVGRMTLNPNDPDNLIVASASGVYVTLDGGTTWTQTFTGGNVQDLNPDPTDFSTLYGGVQGLGIIRSNDAGMTWQIVLNRSDLNRFELDVSPANPDRIFVSTHSFGGGDVAANTSMFLSDDGGDSFTSLTYSGSNNPDIVSGQGWYDNVIRAHPFDPNIAYFGAVTGFRVRITNSGTSFDYDTTTFAGPIFGLNVHPDHHGITFATNDGSEDFRLILNTDGGVFFTDFLAEPGISPDDFASGSVFGLRSTQFYGVDKENEIDNYIGGTQDNANWFSNNGSTDENTDYIRLPGGDGFETIWHPTNTDQFIVTTQFGLFDRTLNRGASFQIIDHPESGDNNINTFFTRLSNASSNPNTIFTLTTSGVWRSTDFGTNWNLTPITDPSYAATTFSLDVNVSNANPDIVWAGTAMLESGGFRPQISTDNGLTFNPVAGVFDDPRAGITHDAIITGIESSYVNDNTAYSLFGVQGLAKILRTTDLGATWEDITGFSQNEDRGFPDVPVHSALEMPFDTDIIWAGTDIGVFQTLDGGANWEIITSIPAVSIWEMKIVNDQVLMATHGRGIWTATVPELLSVDESFLQEFSFFPNPSSDILTISNPQAEIQEVSLVNIIGQEVLRKEINAMRSDLDISNLTKGVYIMQVMSNGQKGVYKVIKG